MRLFFILVLLAVAVQVQAVPLVSLCFDNDCRSRQTVKITDHAWSEIRTLFAEASTNDRGERDKLLKAIALLEKNAFHVLASISVTETTAKDMYNRMNDRDQALNNKSYVALLLDNDLVSRHFIRKIEQRSNWLAQTENVCTIQSHATGKIFIIDSTHADYAEPASIRLLAGWKQEKSIKNLPNKIGKLFDNNFSTRPQDAAEK